MSYDVHIYDKADNLVAVLDNYKSLIWTEHRIEMGDFELHMYFDQGLWNLVKRGFYVRIPDSDDVMIVNSRTLTDSFEDYPTMTFTGNSWAQWLERRIISWPVTFHKGIGAIIYDLLNRSCLATSNEPAYRKFPNFYARNPSNWGKACANSGERDDVVEVDYHNVTVYECIKDLLEGHTIMTVMKITKELDGKVYFELTPGVDHSFRQSANEWVTFSNSFQNLVSSEYKESGDIRMLCESYAFQDKNKNWHVTDVDFGDNHAGYDREEHTSQSLSFDTEDAKGNTYSENELQNRCVNAIIADFNKNRATSTLSGTVDPKTQWTYREDYTIGDLVNFVDIAGNTGTAVISGVTITADNDGLSIVPELLARPNAI